jgi:predicted enzyme related to lactoylglutathione lyase
MAKPAVVQFEITGKDSAALSRFYASLFGWEIQTTATPGYYLVGANEKGIPGGIGPSRDGGSGRLTL